MKQSVAGVIFNNERTRVLLIKRRDVNIWVIPGGGIDQGETPEDAIVREFFEETGLTVVIKRQVAHYTPVNRLTNNTFLFECTILKGELALGDETKGIDFFPMDQLPEPIFFLHRDWIEEARNQQSHIVHKSLSQITYLNLFKYFLSHPAQVFRILLSRCGIPFNTN